MKIISVYSAKGGSGATTTAANLGAALHAEGLPVLLIDFCPSNMLRLHFGLSWNDNKGLITQIAKKQPWYSANYRSNEGVDFIPYGRIPSDTENAIPSLFRNNPNWLRESLFKLALDKNCWVIIDCPNYQTELQSALSANTDHNLLVITADPACYASLQNQPDIPANTHCLVNRFNPLMALERDVHDLLQADYRQLMTPMNIHLDEAVREALAFKQTVFSCAPQSQAAHDYATLATWLRGQLSEEKNDG